MIERVAFGEDGTRLYVREREGPSPPTPGLEGVTAVLCDGIACDGFIWKYLWDDLSRVVRVVHWNYRGHGRSAAPADPARLELVDHAKDLDAVRRAVGDPPVVVFGHSMGCQVALEAYRLRPEGMRGLVLITGSYGRVTHTFRGTSLLAQMLPRMIERVDAHPELARALWSRLPAEMALKIGRLTGDFDGGAIRVEDLVPYMRHMVDIDLPMFLRMLHAAGEHSAEAHLAEVAVPALVIAGDKDQFTPPAYTERMATGIPGAEFVLLPGATHVAALERREVVEETVERFLREKVAAWRAA